MCNYSLAWIGPCNKQPVSNGMCEEHSTKKCVVCGNPAIGQCAETNGLVCGADLCPDCEHQLTAEGVNDGFKHCRKSEQKYLPWYMQKNNENH